MRRVWFYTLLILQAGVLLGIGVQYYLIGNVGKPISLLTDYASSASFYPSDHNYIEYEINEIPQDIWKVETGIDYQEKVYVVLAPDEEEIYHPVRVTKNKPKTNREEIVFPGSYQYEDTQAGIYHIDYGIERLHEELMSGLNRNKQWEVTVHISPWGQKAVKSVKEIE